MGSANGYALQISPKAFLGDVRLGSFSASHHGQKTAISSLSGQADPKQALPAMGSRSLELKRNLNRGLSLTSEQSYFRGDDNLTPRQICRDGHYQIELVMLSVQLGFDPSKGAI